MLSESMWHKTILEIFEGVKERFASEREATSSSAKTFKHLISPRLSKGDTQPLEMCYYNFNYR